MTFPLDASEILLLLSGYTVLRLLMTAVSTSAIVAAIERTRPTPTSTHAQSEVKS
ncbi:MAG: hypothetical protein HOO99_14585 [Hyphomicrobiaceae bacterium]|nr:hypothetical protein [Hyphomicrobiaceae bacterium]